MKFERKFFVLPPYKLVNGSYVPTVSSNQNYTNPNNPVFKNRHALPNLPMQSTFKSLFSVPVNNGTSSTTNPSNSNANSYPSLNGGGNGSVTNGHVGSNGTKVYYRPQDLTAANLANRLQNNNKSNENMINSLNSSNEKLKNELYLLQKNSSERLYNGLPANPAVVPPPPLITNASIKSGKRISTRKLTINSSPTIATRNLDEPANSGLGNAFKNYFKCVPMHLKFAK